MARMDQVGSHKTKIATIAGMTAVIYHSVPVIRWDNEKIVLNSGGWYTPTTKTRINQAANQFDLPVGVYQKDRQWFVVVNRDWGNPIPFEDEMIISR